MPEGSNERQEGRGRLSSIDLLPEEAEPDILWAAEQLRERTMPAKMILSEFNARLADRGIGPIKKSAWGRWSIRKAVQFRKLDEARQIASELVPSLGTDGPDHVTILISEMVKVAAFQLLEGGDVNAKGLMELSRAVATVVGAQKTSAEHTGLGIGWGDDAQKNFGTYRVENVTFTPHVKEALAYPVRSSMEARRLRIPYQNEIRADLRSVTKQVTAAGNIRFTAERTADGHADRFWGLALAIHAANGLEGNRWRPLIENEAPQSEQDEDFIPS